MLDEDTQQNRIAIVTGVSRLKGIGRAICVELAKRNIDIFFTYWKGYDAEMLWGIDESATEIIHNELLEIGVRSHHAEINLSSPSAIDQLLSEVQNHLGLPSILVNNATYSTQTDLESLTGVELDRHYILNINAATMLTTKFARLFNGPHGRIVNLVSGEDVGPMDEEVAYAITKGAISTLTQTSSKKLAEKNITINAVNPGPTDTGWMSDSLKHELLKKFPSGRIGEPSDAARLVAFLCSPEAEWITGQIIHSEGGFIR